MSIIAKARVPSLIAVLVLLLGVSSATLACNDDEDGESDVAGSQATAVDTEESATEEPTEEVVPPSAPQNQQSPITLTDTNLQAEQINGLNQPTQIAFLGPDDLLVTEKSGNVVRVRNGQVEGPVLELAANYADERGVLGIALHPEFETNNWVYIYWTWSGEGTPPDGLIGEATEDLETVAEYGNRVDRFIWDGSSLSFDSEIIQLPSRITDLTMDRTRGNHNAGVIKFGPDGNLYVVNGDQNARGRLQNVADGPELSGRDALQGVLLRLNDDGTIPEDNPFAEQFDDERAAIYLYGIRNTFGYDFDPDSGELWLEVNGQASYDELGRYEAGQNLGWIQIMGPPERFEDYKALEIDTERKLDNPAFPPEMLAENAEQAMERLVMLEGAAYQEPQVSWRIAVAPTAVKFIEGDALGVDYAGDLLVGDVNTGHIYHFELAQDRMTLDLEGPLADGVNDNSSDDPLGELVDSVFAEGVPVVTDIKSGPDGTLWITSGAMNALFRITAVQ